MEQRPRRRRIDHLEGHSLARGARKGKRTSNSTKVESGKDATVADIPHQIEGLDRHAETLTEFQKFIDLPFLFESRSALDADMLQGKKDVSRKTNLGKIAAFAKHLRAYQTKFRTTLRGGDGFDRRFPFFCIASFANSGNPQKNYHDFERISLVAGAPRNLIPENPFPYKRGAMRTVPSETVARRALNIAKIDAWEIVKRHAQANTMLALGRHPARERGGKRGDADRLENRLFACRDMMEQGIFGETELYAKKFWGILGAMKERPGAIVIDPEKGPIRANGVMAHVHFYHPSPHDLFPFVTILMLRGMLNLATVCETKVTDRWCTPYPYVLDPTDAKDFVMIVLLKHRGSAKPELITKGVDRSLATGTPNEVKFPSSTRPWSHPYKILKFLVELTQPLRDDVMGRISLLRNIKKRTVDEEKELLQLTTIKDDLFIYRTKVGVGSFRETGRLGLTRSMVTMLKRYGLSGQARELRDAGLTSSFRASGWNLMVLRMLASHEDTGTSSLYARRRQTVDAARSSMKDVAANALVLARTSGFSITGLRQALTAQGLNPSQIDNVIDKNKRTRFDSGCVDPYVPPPGFDRDTPPGDVCRLQDCIDGCDNARFLPQSLPHLIRERIKCRAQLQYIGPFAASTSILSARVQNLDRLISEFPARAVRRLEQKIAKETITFTTGEPTCAPS